MGGASPSGGGGGVPHRPQRGWGEGIQLLRGQWEGNVHGFVPHRPPVRGSSPSHHPILSAGGCSSAAAQHRCEGVWGFPLVSLQATLPAWHWSQQHPAVGCLCTAGGGCAAE